MIPYPTTLPLPDVSLSASAETPTIRTDISGGLIEQFGRFATGREIYQVNWQLSEAELVIFEEWFAETLIGGVLVFGLMLPRDGGYEEEPVRFVGGTYGVSHKDALWWTVTASVERMIVANAPTNRTLPVPQWLRLSVDEALSQNLTLSHRNALLTVRPDEGSTTTFRIYPPTSDAAWIYFGISNLGDGETLITSEDVDPLPPEAVPSWPETLPNLNHNFRMDAERKAARIEMESGHSRQYADKLATVRGHDVEFDFSLEQLETFQDFFYTTLKSGSLIFWLTLPVDGQFQPVRVRIVEGRYSETYIFHDTFRVAFKLDRIVDQTVLPTEERPFPMYYAPTVNVATSRKILASDAGKFFIVNPSEGETINLHISSNLIEFGLLVVGPGNVLITREPFVWEMVSSDSGTGEFRKLGFELRSTELDLGSLAGDSGTGEFLKLGFALVSIIKDIGSLPGDSGSGEFGKLGFEMINVLEDLGTLSGDSGTGEFLKLGFELVIP